MSTNNNRRRRSDRGAEEHADERWLLTYSDMITLLMALFIVLWSISSVNISKFEELKVSLKSAFSGKVLPANTSILNGQSAPFSQNGTPVQPVNQDQSTTFKVDSIKQQLQSAAAQSDLENLKKIEQRIETYAQEHGFSGRLRTSIDERGLVVRLLTDEVLFDTGKAVLKTKSLSLLAQIAKLVSNGQIVNSIRVEGNTDNVPISGTFRSNWELSTGRATAVLEFLLAHGVAPSRLSATGYADQRPIATNATAVGRSLNRRVDLVVLRRSFGSS